MQKLMNVRVSLLHDIFISQVIQISLVSHIKSSLIVNDVKLSFITKLCLLVSDFSSKEGYSSAASFSTVEQQTSGHVRCPLLSMYRLSPLAANLYNIQHEVSFL